VKHSESNQIRQGYGATGHADGKHIVAAYIKKEKVNKSAMLKFFLRQKHSSCSMNRTTVVDDLTALRCRTLHMLNKCIHHAKELRIVA
jgi:hypothetical protein